MYHEIVLRESPKQTIIIKPGHAGEKFDLDHFGQDDGEELDSNFRLIFQLGSGLMIYLYVVGFPMLEPTRYFHTFWIKDCAVAEVDMEELGAPSFVEGVLSVPAIFKRVSLLREDGNEKIFVVDSGRFDASFNEKKQRLQMQWNLYSLKDGKLSTLYWENSGGWSLEHQGKIRTLQTGERVLFSKQTSK